MGITFSSAWISLDARPSSPRLKSYDLLMPRPSLYEINYSPAMHCARSCVPFFLLIQASIEGFVTCPFCDYGAILEDENDKEFRCQNKECEKVSCRACRVESHIPLSCEGCSHTTLLMRTQKGE